MMMTGIISGSDERLRGVGELAERRARLLDADRAEEML